MNARRVSAAVVGMMSAAVLAAQPHPMRPGQWEVTGQMEMPGAPKMPEMKSTQCITAEMLKDPGAGVAMGGPGGKPGSGCKATDQKITATSVSWKMSCPAPQSLDGTGELAFKGDTYAGTMTMKTPQGTMTMKVAGKRLGDCK